jgi:hypothetical protein
VSIQELPVREMKWVYLAILLAVALSARLYMLDELPYGLNADETRMAYDGYLYLEDGVYRPLVYQQRESTLPYVYGGLITLYGFSNGVIRFPSALLGMVSCLSLCLLIFRVLPDFWAFCTSLVVVTYGPLVALDRLALRTSVCTAVVFVFLAFFFFFGPSDKRLHWFFLGFIFGVGFHTYNAYKVMPLVVMVLLAIHVWDPPDLSSLWRKMYFFIAGAFLGAANLVYTVLTESPDTYLWRETAVFGKVASAEGGPFGTILRNLLDFARMLLGQESPLPWGAMVGYFHFVWVPLLAIGVYTAARSRPRSVEFALLITFCVFLVPGLLSTEMFARRILTPLVLAVTLSGIGLYEVVRKFGWELNRRVRAGTLLLAVGLAVWNMVSYFVVYAAQPKWEQGPFSAAHRWIGPQVRELVDPATKVIFAEGASDYWLVQLYLTDILDVHEKSASFFYMPDNIDDAHLADVESFCAGDNPVLFVFRGFTPEKVVEGVVRRCDLDEVVPLDRPGDIYPRPARRFILMRRSGHCDMGRKDGSVVSQVLEIVPKKPLSDPVPVETIVTRGTR